MPDEFGCSIVMKAIIRLKSFEGHVGIPGHQGGSLPRGESATPVVVDKYYVEPLSGAKSIDFSNPSVNIANNANIDNSKEPPYVMKNGYLKRLQRTSDWKDVEVMKEIAKNEKEFYDNPMSTGPDEHTEVRLYKMNWGYGIEYTTFYLDENKNVVDKIDYMEDFSRCPVCKYPTISPDSEKAYNECSTCNIEYISKE